MTDHLKNESSFFFFFLFYYCFCSYCCCCCCCQGGLWSWGVSTLGLVIGWQNFSFFLRPLILLLPLLLLTTPSTSSTVAVAVAVAAAAAAATVCPFDCFDLHHWSHSFLRVLCCEPTIFSNLNSTNTNRRRKGKTSKQHLG